MNWQETFIFEDRPLYYNRINYNNIAERAVEIPIVFNYLAHLKQKRIVLEVGNVLSNYENSLSELIGIKPRKIIDKFEVAPGVDNVDLMDLSNTEQYDPIIAISTVEHVAQGYGGQSEDHDSEAPLKAIAKIYDLLLPEGKALITVPFGKLLNGGWYIQFSQEYLQLLVTQYGIPEAAISVQYLKRIATELIDDNPRQLWVQVNAEDLKETDYGWLWPFGNGLAVIELTKQPGSFTLNLNVQPTSLIYQPPLAATLNPAFIQSTYELFHPLNSINLIAFPDWSAPEETLRKELGILIQSISNHPDRHHLSLFICTDNITEEEAGFIISAAMMELLSEDTFDGVDEPPIYPLQALHPLQWQVLLARFHGRVALSMDDPEAIANAQAASLPLLPCDRLLRHRAIPEKTGLWSFAAITDQINLA